ncbi:MAG: gliding motility protein GldN [Bacteroidota bacterium]|jgi:gliding motility associated protien GldN
MKKVLLAIVANSFCIASFAQSGTGGTIDPPTQSEFLKTKDDWAPSLRPDGIIDRVPHVNKVVPWQRVRENDVLYAKKIWREIDTRQKQNFPFMYPGDEGSGGGMFIEILINALKKGELTPFMDDRFTSPMTYSDVQSLIMGKEDSTSVFDPTTGTTTIKVTRKDFDPTKVTRFRIKEQVVFDRVQGRERHYILGICPVLDVYDADNEFKGTQPLFWIYYPEARNTFVKYEVYNTANDIHRETWDDFMEKRRFSSFITKSTFNNYDDADIAAYKNGLDRQLESERIKEMLFNKEQDLWAY